MRARGRVPLCRLDEAERRRLRRLLDTLASRLEKRFREVVSRILDECLASVGLVPRDVPEQVARDKIIAELIDRMLQRGFIAFGDVRDLPGRRLSTGPCRWRDAMSRGRSSVGATSALAMDSAAGRRARDAVPTL